MFLNRVNVIAEYDAVVRSANFQMALPSVIALREFIKQDRSPAFTRFNVFFKRRVSVFVLWLAGRSHI